MQASMEVTSSRPTVTTPCSRPCTDLRSGIGLGVARLLGVRLPERAVPFVRRRYAAAETALRFSSAMPVVGRATVAPRGVILTPYADFYQYQAGAGRLADRA